MRKIKRLPPEVFSSYSLTSLCCAPRANAQSSSTIKGHITDEHGGSLAAEDSLSSRAGFRVSPGQTRWELRFCRSDPGNYILEVRASGFAASTSKEVRLAARANTNADLQLSVASVNENVVVIAAGTPQRADEVSKAITVLDEQEIEAKRQRRWRRYCAARRGCASSNKARLAR